jgi:hypothetical protein
LTGGCVSDSNLDDGIATIVRSRPHGRSSVELRDTDAEASLDTIQIYSALTAAVSAAMNIAVGIGPVEEALVAA